MLHTLCHNSTHTTISAIPSFELAILIRFSVIFSVGARHPTLNLHQLHMQVMSKKGKISGRTAFIVGLIKNLPQAFSQDITD